MNQYVNYLENEISRLSEIAWEEEEQIRADEREKTIEELRSFIEKYYENIVFELKSGGKIEDANRVIDKFVEQLKEKK